MAVAHKKKKPPTSEIFEAALLSLAGIQRGAVFIHDTAILVAATEEDALVFVDVMVACADKGKPAPDNPPARRLFIPQPSAPDVQPMIRLNATTYLAPNQIVGLIHNDKKGEYTLHFGASRHRQFYVQLSTNPSKRARSVQVTQAVIDNLLAACAARVTDDEPSPEATQDANVTVV